MKGPASVRACSALHMAVAIEGLEQVVVTPVAEDDTVRDAQVDDAASESVKAWNSAIWAAVV